MNKNKIGQIWNATKLFFKKPISENENKFPLAYARNDYRFLEAELATNYHPQNWYCYAIDSKANPLFRKRMHALANCFPNIIIPSKELSVDSAGHSTGSAFMSCLNELVEPKKRWEYVFTLQNHDTQIKTNEEIVQIFKWLDGANSIEFEFRHVGPQRMIKEMHQKHSWTFDNLHLFKNETMNNRFDKNGNPLQLQLTKGLVETALSRPFTDFIVKELNLTKMLAQLDTRNYGADELFFQTIGSSDHLNAPNGFTHKCVEQKIDVPYIIRYSVWDYGPGRWENVGKCHSHNMRHYICMLGIEDLAPTVTKIKHLFVNKMMPSIDFGAIYCWHEEMRRRTLTRFHQEWLKTNGNVDLQKFNCSEPTIPN
ncbi:hypothetical protein Mgra_00006964 [Meloidogyne graminicola]|uniref:Uncharacterized protein n=1 Tax=Meloidogyne graminicola TaxID=189291 RepID=A0A8S9ZJV7_9BILA|nr:hypothetical protein Mgra_00006964 [Meloidogyne graminicola]